MNNEWIARRATDRLREADAKLTAAMHGVVYGERPRWNRKELLAALGFVLVVLAALGLFWPRNN